MIITISGYTKSEKTEIAYLLQCFIGGEIYEMSSPIREKILTKYGTIKDIRQLIKHIYKERELKGVDILARYASNFIKEKKSHSIIVGIRSYYDFNFINEEHENVKNIFIHSSENTRHFRMQNDIRSVAKTEEDFRFIDLKTHEQGISNLAEKSDYQIINDFGYPLTPLMQTIIICKKLALCSIKTPICDMAYLIIFEEQIEKIYSNSSYQIANKLKIKLLDWVKKFIGIESLVIYGSKKLSIRDLVSNIRLKYSLSKFKIIYCEEGQFELHCRKYCCLDQLLMHFIVKRGEAIFIPPYIAFRISNSNETEIFILDIGLSGRGKVDLQLKETI